MTVFKLLVNSVHSRQIIARSFDLPNLSTNNCNTRREQRAWHFAIRSVAAQRWSTFRIPIWTASKPKFHDNEIPRRCARRLQAYFIGRHICRGQRQAFERLIINNRPQQWPRVIKATGRFLPLPVSRKPSRLTAVYCFPSDVKAEPLLSIQQRSSVPITFDLFASLCHWTLAKDAKRVLPSSIRLVCCPRLDNFVEKVILIKLN